MQRVKINVRDYHWQIIINPNAVSSNSAALVDHISDRLNKEQVKFTFHESKGIGAGKQIAQELCLSGECFFIVLGGDGTLNEIVNGIFSSHVDPSTVYLALFPLGTGNDWSRVHHYPTNYLEVLELFLMGNFARHDVGVVQSYDAYQMKEERYFINIAGFSFDAEVIEHASHFKARFFRSYMYIFCLLKALFTHKNQVIHIQSPDFTIKDKIFTIAVGIGQYNGNGMRQVPMGDPFSGTFKVVVIRKLSLLKILKNVTKLFDGTHTSIKEVSVNQTTTLSITTTPATLCEVEGELVTPGNYNVFILPHALNTMVLPDK